MSRASQIKSLRAGRDLSTKKETATTPALQISFMLFLEEKARGSPLTLFLISDYNSK